MSQLHASIDRNINKILHSAYIFEKITKIYIFVKKYIFKFGNECIT